MDGLYLSGHSLLHRLPAQVKIVAAVLFAVVVVATDRHRWQVFVGYGLLVAVAAVVARIPPLVMVRRMAVEVPFVVFALLMPFVATGPRVAVGPWNLSEPGLWAAWNILAKATLGVAVAVIVAATTRPADVVAGLARLRLPSLLVQIAGFMVRYADVVAAEATRMRTAMAARGFRARHVAAWPMVARSLGALFIRTYERGERVHVAMLSRGYDGTARAWDAYAVAATRAQWSLGLVLPLAAGTMAVASLVVGR